MVMGFARQLGWLHPDCAVSPYPPFRVSVTVMGNRILVLYGSYRSDRMGIRLAQFVVEGLRGPR